VVFTVVQVFWNVRHGPSNWFENYLVRL